MSTRIRGTYTMRTSTPRHPELVSGSINNLKMLKRVQHDVEVIRVFKIYMPVLFKKLFGKYYNSFIRACNEN